jgi:hypothetical protein
MHKYINADILKCMHTRTHTRAQSHMHARTVAHKDTITHTHVFSRASWSNIHRWARGTSDTLQSKGKGRIFQANFWKIWEKTMNST